MKHIRIVSGVLLLTLLSLPVHAQNVDKYFYSLGVYHLCQAAHVSNDYLSATYDVQPGYVDISIKSKDNVFGATIHTNLRVIRGTGDLYFSDIIVQGDDDMVRPFEALGLEVDMVKELIRAADSDTYNKMRQSVQKSFNTDFEHWTGKMWALLAINLDYYEYLLKN